jgi:hypothetical protein
MSLSPGMSPVSTHPRSEVEEELSVAGIVGRQGSTDRAFCEKQRDPSPPNELYRLLPDPVRLENRFVAVHAFALEIVE